jgi:hypothetical protein
MCMMDMYEWMDGMSRVRFGEHIETKTAVVIKEYSKKCVLTKTAIDGSPIAEDAKEEIRIHAGTYHLVISYHIISYHIII